MSAVTGKEVGVVLAEKQVVSGVSFSAPAGSWIGVIGPNGAGKSTLLRAIAGLVRYSGDISLDGSSTTSLSRRSLAQLVAFVPQNPFLPEPMSVFDYVLMGRSPYIPYFGRETRADLEIVTEVLERMELAELAGRSLGSLSGGELQRSVLARALAQQAPVLLLDEPTSALDVGHQQQVMELVDQLRHASDLTVISAMHELSLAGQFADSLVLLDGGRAVASGRAADVLTEGSIRRHYGASVQVIETPDGHVLVVPTRRTDAEVTSLDEPIAR